MNISISVMVYEIGENTASNSLVLTDIGEDASVSIGEQTFNTLINSAVSQYKEGVSNGRTIQQTKREQQSISNPTEVVIPF